MAAAVSSDNKVDIGSTILDYDLTSGNHAATEFEDEETVNVYVLPQHIEVITIPKTSNGGKGKSSVQVPESVSEDIPNVFEGEVETFKYKGDDFEIQVKCGDISLLVHTYTKVSVGEKIKLHIPADKIKIKKREEISEIVEEN